MFINFNSSSVLNPNFLNYVQPCNSAQKPEADLNPQKCFRPWSRETKSRKCVHVLQLRAVLTSPTMPSCSSLCAVQPDVSQDFSCRPRQRSQIHEVWKQPDFKKGSGYSPGSNCMPRARRTRKRSQFRC